MDIEITRSETANNGRYIAKIEGSDVAGELRYSRLAGDAVIADHTLVPPALRRHGIASALVRRLVEDARKEQFKIVPRCSFVRAQFDQHPEWADVYRPASRQR